MDEIFGVLNLGIPWSHLTFAIVLALLLIVICRTIKGHISTSVCVLAVFLIYLYILVGSTIVYRDDWYMSLNWVTKYELIPFSSYQKIFENHQYEILLENFLNILLFVPFGLLLRLLFRPKSMSWIVVASVCISFSIEYVQLLTHRGLFEMDDIIHNTIGTVIGCMLTKFVWRAFDILRLKMT